ncbi:DUF1624 domain-containing protein [Ottowia sp.]|uniref:DUF1624 domain-containing protein n=1 Tax=Ottowia sp. TaxID=1898956 RepID=UPI003A899C6E
MPAAPDTTPAITPTTEPLRTAASRFDRIDALRGLAMLWMTVYHFCFDLNHFGYIRQNFYADPLWTWQRTGIVSLFLLCAGMGQALAVQQGQSWPRFWRRWAQVVGCATLVSLASWWMFPRSWISFGVLHGMAVMLLVVRWALARGWLDGARCWVAGAVLIVATPWLGDALTQYGSATWQMALNSRWLNGLGVVMAKPMTEDYVPVLPWLGVMLWGVGLGQALLNGRRGRWRDQVAQRHPLGPVGGALRWLGRWSLSYYMLHQPVLIGTLMAVGGCAGRVL